jgi:membrane protease YdiL (CAAX protease family)
MVIAGLSVAFGGAVGALILYLVSRANRDPLFAPVGPVRPAVNGLAVVAAFAVVVATTPIIHSVLNATGFFRAVYGDDFPAGWPKRAAEAVRFLWSALFAFPLEFGSIVGILLALGGRDTVAPRGWARHAVAGYLTWLLVTPAAFSVFVLANLAHTWLTGQPPDKHPLTELGTNGGWREWTLLVLQTVLMAPLLEEMLFRGLLLPWLARTRPAAVDKLFTLAPEHRPLAVMLLSVGVAVVLHANDVQLAWDAGDRLGAATHLVPGAFFLALIPLELVARRAGRLRHHLRLRSIQHARAILASSALFAAVHAQVWPSPVPLFVLATGLGYLYIRTRSVVGPVVVHGMFNAVSAVYLLLGGPA